MAFTVATPPVRTRQAHVYTREMALEMIATEGEWVAWDEPFPTRNAAIGFTAGLRRAVARVVDDIGVQSRMIPGPDGSISLYLRTVHITPTEPLPEDSLKREIPEDGSQRPRKK